MNRTQAFLLPDIPLAVGVPIIDKTGRRGVVVDTWFCEDTKAMKVRVCRMRRYQKDAVIDTCLSMEVRVDLTSDLGFVYALREYYTLVNAKAREEVKTYIWTWGGLHEQAINWWAKATSDRDERRLIKKLVNISNKQEN